MKKKKKLNKKNIKAWFTFQSGETCCSQRDCAWLLASRFFSGCVGSRAQGRTKDQGQLFAAKRPWWSLCRSVYGRLPCWRHSKNSEYIFKKMFTICTRQWLASNHTKVVALLCHAFVWVIPNCMKPFLQGRCLVSPPTAASTALTNNAKPFNSPFIFAHYPREVAEPYCSNCTLFR